MTDRSGIVAFISGASRIAACPFNPPNLKSVLVTVLLADKTPGKDKPLELLLLSTHP